MMKKLLAILLVLAVSMSFAGCKFAEYFKDDKEDDEKQFEDPPVGPASTEDPNARYMVYLPLFSYEEFEYVWSHNTKEGRRRFYTLDDSLGEEFRVMYMFRNYAVMKPQPKTTEEYLDICTPNYCITYVFFPEKDVTNFHRAHVSDNFVEELGYNAFSEEFSECLKYPFVYVQLKLSENQITIEDVNLEDSSLLTYDYYSSSKEVYHYSVCYNGEKFVTFTGCAELSEDEIRLLVQHLIVF